MPNGSSRCWGEAPARWSRSSDRSSREATPFQDRNMGGGRTTSQGACRCGFQFCLERKFGRTGRDERENFSRWTVRLRNPLCRVAQPTSSNSQIFKAPCAPSARYRAGRRPPCGDSGRRERRCPEIPHRRASRVFARSASFLRQPSLHSNIIAVAHSRNAIRVQAIVIRALRLCACLRSGNRRPRGGSGRSRSPGRARVRLWLPLAPLPISRDLPACLRRRRNGLAGYSGCSRWSGETVRPPPSRGPETTLAPPSKCSRGRAKLSRGDKRNASFSWASVSSG